MYGKFDIFKVSAMNLTSLQTFLAIVETGSLVRASERLNVTQSTVTARLKTLESEIGQTLITRQKSGASMTAAGGRLKRYAETMTDLWRQARQETALPQGVSGMCNIGSHPDLWGGLGQTLFDHIRVNQPRVALSIWQGGTAEVSGWLQNGLVDIALTYRPAPMGHHTVHALPMDRLILVSTNPNSPTHFDPGYVFVEAGEEFGRQHAAAYANAGTARLNFGNATLGLAHILEHGGTAYLPHRICRAELDKQTLFHIKAPEFSRRAFVVINNREAANWPWLTDALNQLSL